MNRCSIGRNQLLIRCIIVEKSVNALCYYCCHQIILTAITEYLSPSSAALKMSNRFDNYVELYCHTSTASFLIPLVYNILLMLVCAVIGFLTRKLPENFNESWFIFVSVSTTLFAWVVFIPAYFTSYYAYLQSAILGFCLVLNCLVTLAGQFGPIIFATIFVPAEAIKFSTVAAAGAKNSISKTMASFSVRAISVAPAAETSTGMEPA